MKRNIHASYSNDIHISVLSDRVAHSNEQRKLSDGVIYENRLKGYCIKSIAHFHSTDEVVMKAVLVSEREPRNSRVLH